MECSEHRHHEHLHGDKCGHVQIKHGDHVDFLHDGHLHHLHGEHVDEHRLEVTGINPETCSRMPCVGSQEHTLHAEAVPHGNHADFLVNGRLHHVHGDHCDDHGPLALA